MIDKLNRNIDYIRISVTDRCNLRCIYCMPKEGIPLIHHTDILTYEELLRLCSCFVRLGISKIKITGGEPLVRKDIAHLIGWIKCLKGIDNVTITTNGIALKQHLPDLVMNGLDGVNISLDTLDSEKFEKITGRDALKDVIEGIDAALQYENLKVKVNCVPMQDTTIEEIIDIAGLARNSRLNIRFIEMMPIGLGKNFPHYSEERILMILKEAFGNLEPYAKVIGNGPAHYYSIPGFIGKIGFISAISHQFCDSCNRVRLTSDGLLKTCLHSEKKTDLKALLRDHQSDQVLEQAIWQAIYDKPISHNFADKQSSMKYEQSHMSEIGG